MEAQARRLIACESPDVPTPKTPLLLFAELRLLCAVADIRRDAARKIAPAAICQSYYPNDYSLL
jgi:hypothetical protein